MDQTQPSMMRLFTALPVPGEARAMLQSLPRSDLDARWTSSDDLHITLRYLGPVPEDSLPAIGEALARVRRPSFHVEVQGLGTFSGGRHPVLWAAVQSTRKLTALAGDINEALAPLGFEMPNKPFTPHITLARLNQPKGLESWIGKHERRVSARWQANSFTLYLSAEPDEQSRRYRALATWPLQG